MSVFVIDQPKIDAAQLLADGELTDKAIAERVGVARETIWAWKQNPRFVAMVDGHMARFQEEVGRRGLANRHRRIKALNDRWVRMQRVIESRADHPDYAEAAGGTTGLLVKTIKMIGSGENAREVYEFAVDVGLLREIREHEKQAAQELGQWTEKREIAGKPGAPTDHPATLESATVEVEAWRKLMMERLLSMTGPPSMESVG